MDDLQKVSLQMGTHKCTQVHNLDRAQLWGRRKIWVDERTTWLKETMGKHNIKRVYNTFLCVVDTLLVLMEGSSSVIEKGKEGQSNTEKVFNKWDCVNLFSGPT